MAKTHAVELIEEYTRLGGHRQLVQDDNNLTTRTWEKDTPEAAAFWNDNIEPLEDASRREVLSFLPSINAR